MDRLRDGTATVSERLAHHVVGTRFEDLPAEVVEKAKDLLVYHLGLAFGGRFSDRGRGAIALAYELSEGGGSSIIVGERRRATLLDAIFAHSELIGLDRDVRHIRSGMAPGRVADPVAWLLGEREHASGRQLITALVVGYDVSCRLGEAQPFRGDYTRVPHKCAFAPFAAAAVAARLLRYDHTHTARVLGRAAHFGMGLNSSLEHSYAFSAIARSIVLASLVSEPGDSALLQSIDGPHGLYVALFGSVPDDLEPTLATLGTRFAIVEASTQPYAGSASHIAPLQAALALAEEHRPRAEEVDRFVAVLPDAMRGRFAYQEARMDRAVDARERDAAVRRSLQLRLALLVVRGAIVERPTVVDLDDAGVRALLRKVTLAFEPMPVDEARIQIAMRGGRVLHAEGVARPLPMGDRSAWLRVHGGRFLTEMKLARLERLLAHLEEVEDVGEILACIVPDSEAVSTGDKGIYGE